MDYRSVSPNGRIYAKQSLRKSLLAKMLREILDTRVMVKTGMKTSKGNRVSSAIRQTFSDADSVIVVASTSSQCKTTWPEAHGGEPRPELGAMFGSDGD